MESTTQSSARNTELVSHDTPVRPTPSPITDSASVDNISFFKRMPGGGTVYVKTS